MEPFTDIKKITMKNLPEFEGIASGHRACQGCGEVLALRQVLKALGEDVIVVSATGCMEVITTPYPQTAWNVPWMHVAFENAAALGSGVVAARKALTRKKKLKKDDTKILIMGGDGGTYDIGFQSLSGALERGHDFIYVCFDNEAYMNTGIQRSSATPRGTWTTTTPIGEATSGKAECKKDLTAIVVEHKIPYVATATPGHPVDLMNKVRRAAKADGPAFIHIFSPCPTGWRIRTSDVVKLCKLAVQTNVYPLYEVINGRYVLNKSVKKSKSVREYLKMQGRFKYLTTEQTETTQQEANSRYAKLEWLASGPAIP